MATPCPHPDRAPRPCVPDFTGRCQWCDDDDSPFAAWRDDMPPAPPVPVPAWKRVPCDSCGAAAGENCIPQLDPQGCSCCEAQNEATRAGELFCAGGDREIAGWFAVEALKLSNAELLAKVRARRSEL